MSIRRKWLKIVMLLFMAGASFIGPMNPQEIEEHMRIMNRNETTITTDEDHNGDGDDDLPKAPRFPPRRSRI